MERYNILALRVSLAIVFIWFGALKLVELSPATELVAQTVFWFPPTIFVPVLGVWEVLIGVFLLFRRTLRGALLLLFPQLAGTMLPLILLPDVCFTQCPYGLTLVGQYVVKNLVLISAGLAIGSTVRYRSIDGQLP